MMRIILPALFFLLALLPTLASAQVRVGDKPMLRAMTVDGAPIALDALRGRLVLIDFWATWCGPCMAEADHMIAINRQYAEKGLCIIGVSLDRDQAALVRVAQQKGFIWPQIFDGANRNALSQQFGVTGIPRTFLLGPDGAVLWVGHPAQMDAPIADAFKNHPPQLLDPKTVAQLGDALAKAEAAATDGNTASAIKLLAKVPAEAKKDAALATRIDTLQKKLLADATKALDDADALVDQKDYVQAAAKLRDIAGLTDLPVATKAKQKLATLSSNPEAKAALAAADKAGKDKDRAAKAADALAAAQKLKDDARHDQAYAALKSILAQYPSTPAAETAAAEVSAYEKDPDFVKRVGAASIEKRAKSMLSMADNYASAGKYDLARQRYQAVIDTFPNTPFADTAKDALTKLPKE